MANNLVGKNEAVLVVKSPTDTLFKKLRSEAYHLPTVSSDKIHSVEVHEGDWESHGSVRLWTYTCEGKKETFKERVEIDDANKKVTLVGLEGDVMHEMKSKKLTFQFIPKTDGSTLVKITIEYEKLHHRIPHPTRYLDLAKDLILDINSHILTNNV